MAAEITINSSLGKIGLVRNFIESELDGVSISEKDRATVVFCLIEAVINAINHGNKKDPYKKVKIAFDNLGDRILMTVKDEGAGFNPDDIADPRKPDLLNRPSGRGIFFMKQMLTKVTFENTAMGTTVTMEQKL